MTNGVDVSGQRFGMLVAVERREQSKNGTWKWHCTCDCGGESVVLVSALRRGHTRSCGCSTGKHIGDAIRKHGKHGGPEYLSWKSMKARCYNEKDPMYDSYGGRGIKVCDRWMESFENFLEYMGERPEGMTLDRIEGCKGYEPGNCQWSDAKEQARNRRSTIMIEFEGEQMARKEFARRMGVSDSAVRARMNRGQTPSEIASHYGALC